MAHIDYYFSTISPYAYLAGTRLEKIAAKHGASVTYKPFDIMQVFARMGGTAPAERHASRMEYRAQELPRQAKKLGLAFNLKPAHWPCNAAPAAYAIIAAQAQAQAKTEGMGDLGGLVHGLMRACWVEERDISTDEVVRECLSKHGFDPKLADSGLLMGAETYGRNLEDAAAAGAFGSPFYVVDGQRFWGQDRLDDLAAYLAGDL